MTREAAVAARIICILVFLATLPHLGVAQPATQPAETPPDKVILVQKRAPVQVLGFGDDGKTVYLYARVSQVNVWRVLVYHWPEAAGVVAVLLTLKWIVQVLRRPQIPGEEHCRCCNYLLKGLTSGRCPECGTHLTTRNRLAGRRRWPRVLGAGVFLVIGTAAYIWAAARLPRHGRVSEWFDWRSMSIAEWAETGRRAWLTRHVTSDDVVLLADVEKGKVRRMVCRIQGIEGEAAVESAVLSADRKFLFCRTGDDTKTGVAQVELASGKVVRQFAGMSGELRVSATDPPRTLFRDVNVVMDSYHVLSTLDIQGDRPLKEISLDLFARVNVLTSEDHDFAVITDFVRGQQHATRVRVWDPVSGRIVKSFNVSGFPAGCDRGNLYVALFQHDVVEIETWDVLAAKRIDTVKLDRIGNGANNVTNGVLVVEDFNGPNCSVRACVISLKTRARRSWVMHRSGSIAVSPDSLRALVSFSYCFGGAGKVDIYRIPEK